MEITTHVVGPRSSDHTHTIILLHGRDSIASEFADEFFESQASDGRTAPDIFPAIKWVFPSSQLRTSARFETKMSQWFDTWSVEDPSEKEELQLAGLRESIGRILSIVRSEALLVPPERIILGGISQGCATAIHVLVCGGIRLGGFIGFSSWLPFQSRMQAIAECSKSNVLQYTRAIFSGDSNEARLQRDLSDISRESALQTPIFLSHSQDDNVVPIKNGRGLYKTLESLGFMVTWKDYQDGGHWINEPQGVDDIVTFLHDEVVQGRARD
jgi:lysophospholipase II